MMPLKSRLVFSLLFLASFMVSHAQWASDPGINNAICRAGNNQNAPRIITDGRGGAIICWYDERVLLNTFDIYAQRIDKDGYVRWTVNGIAVSAAAASQSKPEMVSDGEGGAIIVWTDTRNGDNDVYAQRIDSSGAVRWAQDGIPIATGTTNQADPKIATDGKHGAIVTWNAGTGGFPPTSKIYAMRLTPNGDLRWGTATTVSGTLFFANAPVIASDGDGGAYISYAYFPRPDYDVYAQRVDSNGAVQWASKGIVIASGSTTQDSPMLVADGTGKAFLAYSEWGSGTIPVLQLVVLKKDGTTAASLRVTSTSGGQTNYQMSNIGTGLLAITWEDGRVTGKKRTYAQIIDDAGSKSWAADGVEVSTRTGDQVSPFILSDGSGGVIVAWEDKTKSAIETDVYAQRLSGAGTPIWAGTGVPVCTAANSQGYPRMITDGQNGALVTWEDYRVSFNNAEIFASRILADGTFPIGPPQMTLSAKTLSFGAVGLGNSSTKSITLTNVGGTAVTIASVTSSDPQFTMTPTNNTIAPSGNVTATVKFQPTTKNTTTARIVIQSNSILSPDTVTVSGWGTAAAAIQTDKTTLAFGNVKMGSTKSLAIKISNPGNDTLSISNITSSHQRFSVTISSRVLAPGASFDDTVRFSPNFLGPVSSNLTITSNAATSPTVIPMSGTGTSEVTMTIDHASISFGNVPVGGQKDTTLSITNTGNDTLRISSFTSGNPRFSLETPITTIAPAGVKTFTIRFAPDAAGPLSAVFTVTSNALSSPHTITVDGIGVAGAAIAFTPTQLSFGSVYVGKTKDLVLSINNAGGQKLTVTSITSTNADFSALARQFEVPAAGSFNDTIRFAPSVIGSRSGMLILASNAATSPDTVPVQGTGTEVQAVRQLQTLPGAFTLYQSYPNPLSVSSGFATIRYDLEMSSPVRLTVLNALGQVTAVLVDETQNPGVHSARWTPAGSAPGVYYYLLRVGTQESYGTMVFMK